MNKPLRKLNTRMYMRDDDEGILLGELKGEDPEGWETVRQNVEGK